MIGSSVDLILDLINLVLLHFSILISVGPFTIDTVLDIGQIHLPLNKTLTEP